MQKYKQTPADKSMVTANVASNLGKIPPQALDLEELTLGTVMSISGTYDKIMEYLIPEIFYKEAHQKVCDAIIRLHKKNWNIDILTVANDLKEHGELEEVGGDTFVVSLILRVGTNWNIQTWLLILWEKFISRENIRLASETIRDSFDGYTDPFDNLYKYKTALENLETSALKGGKTNFTNLASTVIQEITNLSNNGEMTGIPTYLKSIDTLSNGFRKGELVILAARPGMGKSALMIQMAINQSIKFNKKVGIISIEMTSKAIVKRIFSNLTTTNSNKYNSGHLHPNDIESMGYMLNLIKNAPMFIEDKTVQLNDIIARATKMVIEDGVEIIYIDYLQLITLSESDRRGRNREQEVSTISSSLKNLSKKLDIPIIALAQLSRKVEERKPQKPILSDLRDSGCLSGETKIYCPHLKKNIRMKDLVDRKDFSIFAADIKKTVIMKAKKCFETGKKEVFEMTLLNGQKIKATSNHRFLTSNGWSELQDISIGDSIGIPMNYDDRPDNYLKQEVSLIGHFLSNGSALKKQPIRYACNIDDDDLCDVVMNDALIASGNKIAPYFKDTILEKSKFKTIFFKPTFHLTHGKTSPIADIMRKYGLWDKRTKEKFIPEELFYLSHENTYILLKSLFSGDGTVYYQEKNGRKSLKISYSSASEDLIYGIQNLLQKVGIVSFISSLTNNKNQSWFNLYIAGKSNIELFVKNIGFWNKRKNDIMVNGWSASKDNLAGWNKYNFNEERSICFMPVKSIISQGIETVYDIEVPILHNFIANGIIVHNSIEQDADMVVFLYRPEYYKTDKNIPEDTDGKVLGEIAKQREGSTGNFTLNCQLQFTKFDDEQTEGITITPNEHIF